MAEKKLKRQEKSTRTTQKKAKPKASSSIARTKPKVKTSSKSEFDQEMKNIILPQTLSIVIPPLTNQSLTLIKESAILSTITVHELTMSGLMVQGETFRPFEVFIMVALLYWALNETIATIMRKFEKKIQKKRKTISNKVLNTNFRKKVKA